MVFVERVRWASRCKDAGSPDSGAIGATEDAAARRSSAAARLNHYFAKPSYLPAIDAGRRVGSMPSAAASADRNARGDIWPVPFAGFMTLSGDCQ